MTLRTIHIGAALAFGVLLQGAILQAEPLSELAGATEEQEPTSVDTDSRSASEIVEDAKDALLGMRKSAKQIGKSLAVARVEKDIIKMLCLSDKLDQMNVATSSAADRVAGIEAAVSAGNSERVNHDDAVLGALASRGLELAVEAEQCIGIEQGKLGDSNLEVDIASDIPRENVAELSDPGGPGNTASNLPSVAALPVKAAFDPNLTWIGSIPTPSSPTR